MQFGRVCPGFLCRAHVGFGNDFQQWDAAAVIVNERVTICMREFACVLFQMDAANANVFHAHFCFDLDDSVCSQGLVVLRDLIPFWQVGIEIILASKNTFGMDLTAERQPYTDRQFNGLFIQDRQRARLTRANRTNITVRFGSDRINNFAPAKHL